MWYIKITVWVRQIRVQCHNCNIKMFSPNKMAAFRSTIWNAAIVFRLNETFKLNLIPNSNHNIFELPRVGLWIQFLKPFLMSVVKHNAANPTSKRFNPSRIWKSFKVYISQTSNDAIFLRGFDNKIWAYHHTFYFSLVYDEEICSSPMSVYHQGAHHGKTLSS